METKRDDKPVVNSANVLRALLYLAIIRQASAEVGLLHVMRKCHFDVRLLQRILSGPSKYLLFAFMELIWVLNRLFRGSHKSQFF